MCTTSALQPFEVARPRQAVQTMDSFLRWWRGGSNGERRTITHDAAAAGSYDSTTSGIARGVSLIAACCIAFNLVMGSRLPRAAGGRGAVRPYIITAHDGRRLSGHAHVPRLGGRGQRELKPWRRACYEANRRRRRCSRSVAKQALSDARSRSASCAAYFAGKSWRMAYAGTFLLYYLATLWAYAFVFAGRLSTFSPLFGHAACKHDVACATYRKCTFIFWYISRTWRDPRAGRADNVSNGHVGDARCHCRADGFYGITVGLRRRLRAGLRPRGGDTAPFVRFAGLGRLLPATVFAQNMGGQVPLVAGEMRDRDDLNKALCAGLARKFCALLDPSGRP